MKILFLILSCCLGLSLKAGEARIWMDATINGQRVRLVFDTGATDSVLFRSTAERLKLKLVEPEPGLQMPAGIVNFQVTEPLDFAYGAWTERTQFGVIDIPSAAVTEAEGFLSWFHLSQKVLIFDATTQKLDVGDVVPERATGWPKFKQRTDTRLLAFETGGADPLHHAVYVDTGAEFGVALSRSLWEKWVATRTNQPATMTANFTPAAGLIVSTEMWASEISIGSLVLTEVPVRPQDVKMEASFPDHAATLGLFALHRLDLVVGGTNGVVYTRAKEGPASPYVHNQLGAVFAPRDMESDPLVAHVAPASPAYLAGIRDHDVLLKIDDLDITKWRTEPQLLRPRYWERPEGTTYRLTLKRGEREYQTTVVLKRILGPPAGDGSAASQSAAQPTEADRRFLAEVRAAAEKSDAHAQYDLGTIFHLGRLGVAKDEVEAVKWFRQAAEQNLPNAQNTLGSSYANGQGVTKDEFEAVKWYRKAADQNLAVAQFNLAGCYARGLGVAKDPVAAVKWYRQAAEQNFAEAQNNLAACYGNGQGVAKDEVEAVKWYRKAAEQGFPDAQNNLGVHYYKGQGAPQDYAEALKWIRQAAEQNYIEAQKNLAVFYFSGKAGTTNYVEAVKWFRKAAEQNSAEAQFGLGACYYGGQGVAKDYVQAYKWGLLALAQGLEPAREIVHQLETELTPKQILEGQKLARDFKPSLP